MNGSWSAIARSSQRFTKALFLYRLFVGLHRMAIIIKPQNRTAFLEKYDRPSTTLYPRSCSLYRVRGKSVEWSILDLTRACECDVALERYCSMPSISIIVHYIRVILGFLKPLHLNFHNCIALLLIVKPSMILVEAVAITSSYYGKFCLQIVNTVLIINHWYTIFKNHLKLYTINHLTVLHTSHYIIHNTSTTIILYNE